MREILLCEAGLSQTELASRLGTSRRSVNMILNERRPVTTDMAHRLGRAFGNSPEFWLNVQQAVDLWGAYQEYHRQYERIRPVEKAS